MWLPPGVLPSSGAVGSEVEGGLEILAPRVSSDVAAPGDRPTRLLRFGAVVRPRLEVEAPRERRSRGRDSAPYILARWDPKRRRQRGETLPT